VIYYGPPELGQHARADVFSLETRLAIAPARARLPVVQGNLDPVTLVVGPELTRARTRALLERAGPAPGYIFNLGHGVIKETPIASVEALVEEVRAWKA
jgi:uroporphyrinogen decarboxylase